MDRFQSGQYLAVVSGTLTIGEHMTAELALEPEVVVNTDPFSLAHVVYSCTRHMIERASAGSSQYAVVDLRVVLGAAQDIGSLRRGLSDPVSIHWVWPSGQSLNGLYGVIQKTLEDPILTHFT